MTRLSSSSGNLAYVLELDPRDPRFFAPLYKGSAPVVLAVDCGDHSCE